MLVKDVMSKSRRQVMPDTSIAEAMLMMRFYQCDGLPVTVDKELVGFVHLRDLLAMFFEEKPDNSNDISDFDSGLVKSRYAPLIRVSVKQVMVEAIKSISGLKPVNEAMNLMLDDQISSIAVTDGNKLVGMISFDDVNKAILKLTTSKVAS